MAWFILAMITLNALHVLYQLVVTDKDAITRVASVIVISVDMACAYWLYFVSGLFA